MARGRSPATGREGGQRGAARRPTTKRRRETTRRRLARIADLLEEHFGKPSGSRGGDVVGGLVRTILSQNTTDANSRRAYEGLRERYPTWDAVRRAGVRGIESAIRSGGLARIKARRISSIIREIRRERGDIDLSFLAQRPTGEVVEYLERFKGVGPKTAACVALFELGREVMPVDTHVHRVLGRLGVVGHSRNPCETFRALEGVVPEGRALSLHVNLIRLGRLVCRARRPACDVCPLVRVCEHASRSAAARGGTSRGVRLPLE